MSFRCISVCLLIAAAGCAEQPPVTAPPTRLPELSSRIDDPGDGQAKKSSGSAIDKPAEFLARQRTPEIDPNVSGIGPKLGIARRLAPVSASCERFTPDGRYVVYFDPPKVWAVSLEEPDTAPEEVMVFAFTPRDIRVLNNDLDMIIQEGEPNENKDSSPTDPMRIWMVTASLKEKQLLAGPEKDLILTKAPVSPDFRFVVIEKIDRVIDPTGTNRKLMILDRQEILTATVEMENAGLSVVDWKSTETGWRAQVVAHSKGDDGKVASETYFVDPAQPVLENPEVQESGDEIVNLVSKDGKTRVRVTAEEMIVTDLATGVDRRIVIHPDDKGSVNATCVEWVSPRYLRFNTPRLSLIDITTMKVSFLSSDKGWAIRSSACQFAPDFRRALFRSEIAIQAEQGLYVAPVESPNEGNEVDRLLK